MLGKGGQSSAGVTEVPPNHHPSPSHAPTPHLDGAKRSLRVGSLKLLPEHAIITPWPPLGVGLGPQALEPCGSFVPP